MLKKIAILTLLAAAWPAQLHAWWNEDWSFRKEVTLDAGAPELGLEEGVADVPVLLRFHSGNFSYFFDVKEGAADLRVVAGDDVTPLKHDVESWDPINELGLVWVRVPRLAAGGQESIYVYYGNQLANAGDDPAGVSDDDTVVRLDFAGKGTPRDTTAYGNHPSRVTGEVISAAYVGAGLALAPDQGLAIPAAPSLAVATEPGFTASLWLKPEAAGDTAVVTADGEGEGAPAEAAPPAVATVFAAREGEGEAALSLIMPPEGLAARLVTATGEVVTTPAVAMNAGAWQHVAVVLGPRGLALYVNGTEAAAVAAPAVAFSGGITLGADRDGGGGFAGEVDEFRVSAVARPAAWIGLLAANQGPGDVMLSYGSDEARDDAGGGEHVGHFGIIFQAVFGNPEAVVEQGVIIVCGLMAAISLLVMFFKGLFLVRAEGASKRFLRAFQHMDQEGEGVADLGALYDAHKRFGDSPLFRVYRLGIDEVRTRVGRAVGAQASGLDAKAITSVRAAMDSAMVRERQRMDSRMVLLTIAISGGPFIGLFGTVVGVMVTFAAIAQVGDVNITTIAPGMAAALLATVSGLGVAIPALFGYNYLGSRIKSLTADMHVFADELLSKINEAYGR